jgi:hypothetical protein
MTDAPRFQVVLESQRRPPDDIHGLRAVLKQLLRRYDFKCLGARELRPEETP